MKKILSIKPFFYLIFILSLLLVSGSRVEATNENLDFDKQKVAFTLEEKSESKENDKTIKKPNHSVFPSTGEQITKSLTVLGVIALSVLLVILIVRKRRLYEK